MLKGRTPETGDSVLSLFYFLLLHVFVLDMVVQNWEHSKILKNGPWKKNVMCQRRTWTLCGEVHLLTLEALWIRDMKPSIKDEYKSRERVIKF